jgi:hypothetical protein
MKLVGNSVATNFGVLDLQGPLDLGGPKHGTDGKILTFKEFLSRSTLLRSFGMTFSIYG